MSDGPTLGLPDKAAAVALVDPDRPVQNGGKLF
jgi:hypothetical protein